MSVVITRIASATSVRRCGVALERGGDHAETDRLREHERVAGARAAVGEHRAGIDGADDREPELRLGVVDRVAAADERARGAHDVGATVEHAREQLEREAFAGHATRLSASSGAPPIAYTSDSALVAAMRPQS